MAAKEGDRRYTYMGRYCFRSKPKADVTVWPELGDKLPQGEWTSLPAEVSQPARAH